MSGVGRLVPQAAMAMAVLATVGGGWLGWGHWRAQPVHDELYVTQRGQRMSVDLPDGSRLQLDAATRMEALLYRDRREVRLVDGQVMFNVHSDAERPFDVLAGHTRVTVVGTRFSVRHAQTGVDAGKTVVQVESGRVRVAQMGSMSAAVELGPGMAVTADEQGRLERTVSVAPNSVGAWRAGRVSFSDTPLSQALAEFERYGETRLMVRDPAVAAMRVGGSFDLREVGTFAQALPLMLPVKLKKLDAATEIVPVR
ncbi:iron dicitrate transport regulator FecR (plasmid) [Diaphorobacter sp. HDW4B]|nr:iron dicitrate transport regulator FecR [Diaphorobacter sp. HDW4B]